MAADADPGGILGNAIALAALIGGAILTAFATVRALLRAGRDAEEALTMSSKTAKEVADHNSRFATVEADVKHTKDTLDKIERDLSELLRRTPRR